MNNWSVYLLECRDGSWYCGATSDIARRLKQHNDRKGAKYTRGRLPVTLLVKSGKMAKGDALKLEAKVKKQRTKELKKALVLAH